MWFIENPYMLNNMIKHPAKYSNQFIPIFYDILKSANNVLDPMAGVGKLALIKDYGFKGKVVCNEIEQEWTNDPETQVDEWHTSDASNMYWADDESFDAICTSPTYGNRMADHFKIKEYAKGWKYITYTHYLGRQLNEQNTGKMHWGEKYRDKHIEIYMECIRVLKKNGIFIVNVSDHIKKGDVVPVADWHKNKLLELGLKLIEDKEIETKRMKFGQNNKIRVKTEHIYHFIKNYV